MPNLKWNNSTDRRQNVVGNRNKKIARPSSKNNPSKCLNNAINQRQKAGNKLRNGTTSKVSNENNFVIDDCGEAQGSNKNNKKSSNNNNNDIAMNAIGSEVREKNVDFVEEWMNTFAFLSREFSLFFSSLFLDLFTNFYFLCL